MISKCLDGTVSFLVQSCYYADLPDLSDNIPHAVSFDIYCVGRIINTVFLCNNETTFFVGCEGGGICFTYTITDINRTLLVKMCNYYTHNVN